ncbi:methyl-accepting chemotaxis protein [Colwelliaceae bacterium MEBiC 14330]
MQSITQKMLFALVGATILVLVLVSSVSYFIQKSAEEDYWQAKRDVVNSQLSVIFLEPVFAYDIILIQATLDAVLKDEVITDITVFDQRNKVLATGGSSQGKADENVTVPLIWTDNTTIGSVRIGYSHEQVDNRLNNVLFEKTAALIVAIILISVFIVILLKQIVISPLNELSSVLGDIAQGGGDLTQRIPIKSNDELGQLSHSFNSFIETVQSIVSALALANQELANVAQRVKNVSERTNYDSQQQRDQTNEALEHLIQLQEATVHIAESAEQTSVNTNNVNHLSQSSMTEMNKNIEKVDLLFEELDNTANIVTKLRVESQNITKVLDVIKGIAEQTNLLALNAAIEAARAGESGRGFSVVADEVRALASKTHDSTNEIETIISSLQSQAQASFDATHHSKDLVSETKDATKNANDALKDISEKINEINNMNTSIASGSEEQTQVTQSVQEGMQKVDDGAERLAQEASSLHSATNELTHVQEKLVEQIERFTY